MTGAVVLFLAFVAVAAAWVWLELRTPDDVDPWGLPPEWEPPRERWRCRGTGGYACRPGDPCSASCTWTVVG